jgi:hypothetical protein
MSAVFQSAARGLQDIVGEEELSPFTAGQLTEYSLSLEISNGRTRG